MILSIPHCKVGAVSK